LAPRTFSLGRADSRQALLEFLAVVRGRASENQRVFIDFSQTRRMFADGTLLFVAELSRLYRGLKQAPVVRCNYPCDRIVEQVLQQVGVFDLIGKSPRGDSNSFDETVKSWKLATGTEAIGQAFEPVLEKYEGIIEKRLEQTMYKGVTEAMTNAGNHAYINVREDGLSLEVSERRWWMFSQERDGQLSVAICDLGIGIPKSLPKTKLKDWTSDRIASFLNGLVRRNGLISADCVMIKAAIELGRSRTDLTYRGRGLQQLKDVIDVATKGSLVIYSNRGLYRYSPATTAVEIINDYSDSIMGTLILWVVPINSVEESETNDNN